MPLYLDIFKDGEAVIILNLPFEYQLFVITSGYLIILPRAESVHEFLLKNCLYKERMLS